MLFLLFLLSPLVSLFLAMKKYKSRACFKNVLWLFIILWGWALVILPGDTGDQVRYLQYFQLTEGKSFSEFVLLYSAILSGNGEIFTKFLLWLLGKFTKNYHVVFAVLAALYGFFYSRIIAYITDSTSLETNRGAFVFAAMTQIGFWYFTVFDFYFATVVWIYSVIRIYTASQPLRFYLLAGATVFVHSAFVFPVIFLFLFHFWGNIIKRVNVGIYVVISISFAIFSFFSRSILLMIVRGFFPGIATQYEFYLISDQITETGGFYYYLIKSLSLLLLFVLMFFYRRSFVEASAKNKLLRFVLVFHSLSMLFYFLPSLNRFTTLATFFLLVVISRCFPKRFDSSVYAMFLMFSIISFSFMLLTYGISGIGFEWIVFGPFFTYMIIQEQTPMISIYKWIN